MASVARTKGGKETLNRKWFLDVNNGTYAAPDWIGVNFVVSNKFSGVIPNLQDNANQDGDGAASQVSTGYSWNFVSVFQRKRTVADATAYDPGQEKLRTASIGILDTNEVDIRFYEMTTGGPKTEAYRGYATVTWDTDGGTLEGVSVVTATLNPTYGGTLTAITHPDAAQAVPTITSVSPAVGIQAGGTLHKIMGTGFMLAGVDNIVASTGIKLGGSGGTAFTSWLTYSDNVVYAIAPAISGGTKAVVVYNAAGISTVTQNIVIT